MTPSPTLEVVNLEQQILSELQGLKGQVRDLRTILMGDGEGETPHGRLPVVERDLEVLRKEVKILTDAHVRYGVYGRFFSVGGGILAGGFGIAIEWATRVLLGK